MADIELDAIYWQETVDGDYQPRLEPAPLDFPDPTNVLYTDTVLGVPGRWYPAINTRYEYGYQYGIDGISETGTYGGGGTPPTIPVFTVTMNGFVATFDITVADPGTTNQIFVVGAGDDTWDLVGTVYETGSKEVTFDAGMYWGYVKSYGGGGASVAEPQKFSAIVPLYGLNHSPAQILAQRVIDLGDFTLPSDDSAWPIFVSNLPDGGSAPDDLAAVFDTTGLKDGRLNNTGENIFHYGIMLEVRSRGYEIGWQKINEIVKKIEAQGVVDVILDGVSYTIHNAEQTSQVLSLGNEPGSKRRNLFTVNYVMTLEKEA